ncbi:MAG: hypothetical protein HON23_00145 [Rickettsiales bacterium]|nr:hypothetical protein [Rickettsiales bacterium]
MKFIAVAILVSLLSSCFSYDPNFAPNTESQAVGAWGAWGANQDADYCSKSTGGAFKKYKKSKNVRGSNGYRRSGGRWRC